MLMKYYASIKMMVNFIYKNLRKCRIERNRLYALYIEPVASGKDKE